MRVGRGVLVNVALGTLVRGVHVKSRMGVGELVTVSVGVVVGVIEGRAVTVIVAVGAVEVGKGPSSASDVRATAVRVLSASRCSCAVSTVSREVNALTSRIKPMKKSPTNNACKAIRFSLISLRKFKFTLAALLIGTRPDRSRSGLSCSRLL